MTYTVICVKNSRYLGFSLKEFKETNVNFGITGPTFHLYFNQTRLRSMRYSKEWVFKAVDAFEDFLEANERRIWIGKNPGELKDVIAQFNEACDKDGFPANKELKPYLATRHQYHLLRDLMVRTNIHDIRIKQDTRIISLISGVDVALLDNLTNDIPVRQVFTRDWSFLVNSTDLKHMYKTAIEELRMKHVLDGEVITRKPKAAAATLEALGGDNLFVSASNLPLMTFKAADVGVAKAVDPSHYKNYIGEMQWLDAMSQIPTLRDPIKFEAAVELQIRKYLDRNGGKDSTIQELKKAQFYLTYLIMYKENGCKPISAANVHARLTAGAN